MRSIKRLTALLLALCLVLTAMPTAAFAADDTATVTVNVTYKQTEARSMLELVNDFRTGDDAWAWDSTDSEQVYYTGLSELAYDYALEEAAMQRAAEVALSYSHTRPNGTSCFTAYSWSSAGENIAAGTALNTAAKAFALWQETDESYSGQGHRRNMLSSSVTAVAVACVYYNGCYYWVQEFRKPASSQAVTTANDSATDVDVEIALSDATVTVTASASSLSLTVGETASLPTLTTKLQMSGAWPSRSGPVTAEATWTVGDESCATLSDGVVTAVAAGSTTLTATVLGETVSVSVTVEEAACEHVTEIQNARDATCTEDGYTGDEVCTLCGETVTVGETIPATGHSYAAAVTEPTCTTGGYTTYTCSVCGDSYVGDETDATGHSYTYTSNGDGTHTVTCAQGDLTAYSESCTYEDGVCASCGAGEPETSTVVASGDCGDGLTWVLDEDGMLTISGSGDMTDWSSSSSAPWYSYQESILSVTIEDGVTSIGNYAFSKCASLTGVTIPDSVTSIGNYAFYYCTSLTSVTIPDSVTAVGNDAFCQCTSLTSVTIGNSVTSIGSWAFSYCHCLTSITIPDSVTTISYAAFYYCERLTSVTIPNSVTTIGDKAFSTCYHLTSLTIPDSVTTIGDYAFYHCYSLTTLTIPDSVISIGNYAFYYCTGLTNVTIPDSVTSIGEGAFDYCTKLTSVTIPSSITSIGDKTFYDCTSLTSVTIPDSVISIGSFAFSNCDELTDVYYGGSTYSWTTITIDNGNSSLTSANIHYGRDISILASGDCGDDVTWVLLESKILTISGTGEMTNYTFSSTSPWYSYRTSVESVVIEDGVTSIGDYAFYCCDSLTSVSIPDSVTSIGNNAFSHCDSLTSVALSDNVSSIGNGAFYYCTNLADITIPDSVTSIGNSVFYNCTSLSNVTIPDGITSIGNSAFRNCTSLTSITIPDSVASIGSSVFRDCTSLTSITIGNSVTSIGDYAFYNCDNLTDVYYTGSEDCWAEISIGSDNTCLTSATIHYNCHPHSYGEPTFTWSEDYSTATASLVCSVGGETETVDATVTSTTVVAVTCTTDGSVIYTATATLDDETYSDSQTVTLPATGHSYIYTDNRDGTHTVTCAQGDLTTYSESCTYEDGVCIYCGSRTCGDHLTWELDGNGVLTIYGTGAMADYTSESDIPWYSYQTSIKTIVIEDGVTSIGIYAFYNCSTLTSVTIPDSVTSIGNVAFNGCTSLTSITIPDSVTSIGNVAFKGCTSLANITIPDSVTSIGTFAFSSCTSLTSVTIPDGVISIGESAFYNCTALADVTIGASVTSIGDGAFALCTSLTSITIPDNVTSIGSNMFYFCTSLTSVTIGNNVSTIGNYAFLNCNSLTSITIPDSVTTIGNSAFYYCSSLTDVYYSGSKSNWAAISIGTNNTCLTSATIHYGVEEPEHSYGSPVWTWASNYSSATAKFTCIDGDDTQTVTATVTYKVTTAATYTAAGTGAYTATVTFNGKTYTDTKTVTIPVLVLTAPTITSLYNSTSGVSVGWDAVDGATSYIVWRLNNSTGKWEKCATTTGTTYLSTSPVSGTTYYYAIEAVNGDVTSGRGTQRYILYMATPKVSLENTTSGIKVSWNSVTGATSGYQVYRRTADTDYVQLTSTTSLTYTDTTAEAGVRYYYIVRSVRGSARSAYASQYITRLTTPTGISVSNTKSGVQVTWSAVTGATSYQVWRKLSGSSSWSKVGTTTDTSYTSTGVTSGKTYVFTVKAVYNSSVSAYNTSGKTIMRLAEPTITLENLVGGLTASWNAVDGAEGYKLYRRSETGSYVLVATLDADELSYTDKAAGAGLVFYYRVQAYNGSYTSSWTSQFNRRIGHTTLSLAKGEDGVVLTWTESGGCTGYYIYRMNEDGSYTRIKTITSANTLTWTDTDVDLTPGNSYTYYIRGYNGSSLGSYTPKTILIEA